MSRAKPRANLLRMGRPLTYFPSICLLLLVLSSTATSVHAQTAGYQEYYVLGYEEHVWQAFNRINDSGPILYPICSTVSLVATANHQVVYYDHWEDGYEADLLHPIQSSTEVYTLTVGASLSLTSTQSGAPDPRNQPVNVDPQRNPSEIRYDGGDRIITSGGPVALTHMMWPLDNSWVGGAWEIYSLEAYADTYSYHVPIGEDLYTFGGGDTGIYGDFRNVYVEIAAFEDNTTISIDNRTDTVNLNLDRGKSYSSLGYINSTSVPSITINVGTTIRSNNPVQVGLITGSDGEFQGRFLIVLPDEHLGADYVVPVPSGNPPNEAEVYLYNPNDFPITIHAYDAAVPYTNFVISPTGYISATVPYSERRGGSYVPVDSAARFTSSDGVFGVVVCADTSEIDYDWGFTGIPTKYLTRDYYVSWAPGDYNIPPQNNGSPVWVTPIGDHTTFYIDYGPLDGIVDQTFTLNILEQRRIFDPDMDNTGMHVWANGEFAAAWGEDPIVAGPNIPYLDLGYPVLPPYQQWLDPIMTLDKAAEPTVLPPTGGTVTFTLVAQAYGGPIVNVSISDTLPISWTYVLGSTTIQYPDGSTTSPDPVISGPILFWDLQTTLDVGQSLTLTFQAQITTTGSVGTAIYDGFESRTYIEGDNWAGYWQEMGEGDGPLAGGVSIADTTPFLGDYHLSIVSATMSLSRSVDLNEFTSPVLRFARNVSMTTSSEYYLDVRTEAGWSTVFTWTDSNLQGVYIQETADLARTDTAIRFRSRDSIGPWVHLYIDEVEIYDAIAANINRGEVIGQFQYAGTNFNSADEANIAISPLKVVKSVNATNVNIKDTLVYTLSYVNLSDSVTATNVVLYDAIPIQYVTFQSASNGGTYSGASGTITWTIGTLKPGDSGSVTFTVLVNNFVEDDTVIKNTAYIVSTQTTAAGSNTVQTHVQAPDIAFTKSGPTIAGQGQTITYTLSYENAGGAQATGIVIRDAMPLSTTYVASSTAIFAGSDWIELSDAAGDDLGTYVPLSSTLIVTPGNVAAGDVGMIRFSVQIDQGLSSGSLIRNWATLDRDMDIPRESNLAATRISELLIDKSAETAASLGGSGVAVAPGGLITYYLTCENVSTTTAHTNVYVREPIPDYTRFVTASGVISYSWNHGAEWSATEPITPITHIRWYESTLPTTMRRVISFTVQVNDTLPTNINIENIAYISSTQTATYSGEWIPSNRVEVETVNLWLEKRANPSLVGAGGDVSYTISYANRGSTDALGVHILDTIPTNTRYITASIYGTGSDDGGNPLLTWDVMTVTAGAGVQTVGYAVTLDAGLIPSSTITNTAVLSSVYGLVTSDPVPVTVVSSADLAVVKYAEQDTVNAGDKLTYTVVISNDGPGSAFGAVVSDTFSTEVQLVPNSISLDPPGAGTPGTDLPILADDVTITGGQRVTVTFAVTILPPVPNGTVVTNTASVTSTYTPTPTTALVTVTVHSPAFTLTKQESTPVIAGAPFTYTIIVTNTGPVTATNVVVTDTLPAEASYISGGSFIPSSNTVSWMIPTIGANDSDQVAVAVSTCQASLSNTLYKVITSTQKIDSPPGPALLTSLTPPLLDARFVHSPADVSIGDIVYFTDTSTTDGGPIIAWRWDFGDGGTAGDPTVTHVYPDPGTYTVTLTVTDTCGFADAITDTLTVYEPVLTVTKRAAWSVVRAGEILQYNVVISNTGQGRANGVLVSDTLPAHTSFVDATPVPIGPLNGVITWPLGTLNAGATQPITVVVRVDSSTVSGTLITNTVAVFTGQGITATDTATTSVETAANLAVTKSHNPDLFVPGETLTYTLTYVNYGPSDAQDVTITDTLPTSVTYGSIVSSPLPAPTPDGQSLTWYTFTLPTGASGTIIFTTTVGGDAFQAITNTIVITSVTADPNPSNNRFVRVTHEFPEVHFASANFSTGESDGSAIITVVSNYPFIAPITVTYQTTTGGTATPGIDYVPTSSTVTIPAWTTSQTFTISILPDPLDEYDETIVLSLTGTSTGTFGTINNPAILTIIDDDPSPSLSVDDASVYEGDSGSVDAVFTLSLDAVSGRAVWVDYVTADNTAIAPADYNAVATTTLDFAPGETAKQITITVQGDTLVEGNETYFVNLTSVVNAAAADSQAIGTIIDNDTAIVSIIPQDDGAEPSDDGHFVVTLTRQVVTPLTVDYVISGTADNGIDYAPLFGLVTIPANAISTTITVNVVDDSVIENPETVHLTLITTDNPRVSVDPANDKAAITIADDYDTATVTIAMQNDGAEPDIDGSLVISLSNPVAADLVINYVVGGTADNGTDYVALSGAATIPANNLTLPLIVAVINDVVYEGDETVELTLTVTSNPRVFAGTPASATLSIADDEKVSVDFASNTYVVGESDSDAIVTVTLNCPSALPITLSYQTATSGTAIPGADYTAISETLVFPAMVTDQTFAISIISDTIDEPDETVILALTEATSATIATTNNPATLTIVDDDELVVDFASATYEGSEASGTALITVALNTISTWQTATIDYATSDDTAIAPDDYAAASGTLTFVPGAAQLTFTVAIVDDGLYEGIETAHLELSSPVNATVGSTNNPATLVIQDNISNVAVIRGTVFKDVNGNGYQDGGETGFSDVLVTLDGTMTTTTNTAGDYFFVTKLLGAHTVIETDPRALALTLFQQAPASSMDQPDYVSTTPNQVNISVTLGNMYQVNFGDAMTDMGFGAIYGIAFEDVDGDGVQDPTEMGIPDVFIDLDGTGTSLTDLNGSYTFSATLPGVHAVTASQPGGYFATTPPQVQTDVILGLGYQIDFGNAPDSAGFATIYGTAFGDDNADGTYGADETGIPGVSITSDGGMAATTDLYGNYSFATTTPGTHVVLETDPNGYSSTTPNTATVNVTLGSGYQVDFGDMEITTCEPDLYEHDEITENVRILFVGTNQVRQFCDDAIDWAWFTAHAGGVYTITTASWGQRADTILTLFDTDWQTLLAQNDNYLVENDDGSSRIIWQAPVDGHYYVRITNKRDLIGERTDYYLRLQGEGSPLSIYLPLVIRNLR
jgi:uncharacterized repeat protein (TIGR01451 family)